MNKCFLSHKYGKWVQKEPYEMYAKQTGLPETKTFLYYTTFTQERKCERCNYQQIKSTRIYNY